MLAGTRVLANMGVGCLELFSACFPVRGCNNSPRLSCQQVSKPNIPSTTGLKHSRLQWKSFPGEFEEHLLRLFVERSAFLQTQLECVDATGGCLQLPDGIGSLWLECILTPPPKLQNVDDETIAAYLKVRA